MSLDRPLAGALARALSLMRETGLRGSFAGGLAVIVWGQPRVTQDLDLLLEVGADQLDGFLATAGAAGYRVEDDARELLEGGFLRLLPPGEASPVALDILRAETPLHREALDRARTFPLGDQVVPVVTPEDLILLKLIAFRPKDTFDLETVVATNRDSLDLGYLRGWAGRLRLLERLEAFLADDPDEG